MEYLAPHIISPVVSLLSMKCEQFVIEFEIGTSQVATKYNFNGPSNGEYNVTQNVDDPYVVDQDVIWSPCGSPVPLNINNKITLTSTSDAGYGYIQSDGNFASNFVWRKCA